MTTHTVATRRFRPLLVALSLSSLLMAGTAQATAPCEAKSCPTQWVGMDAAQEKAVMRFAKDYKRFINLARTETTTVTQTIKLARAAGFKPWHIGAKLTPGAKYYDVNRDRSMTLFIIGEDKLETGAHISASHI